MSDSADLDEQIRLMRIAVINATFERLRYMRMPERVSLLVRSGWTDESIFKLITSEQPLTVKARLGLAQLFKVINRRRIVFALLVVFVVTAYLGRETVLTVISAMIEAAQSSDPASSVEPAANGLPPTTGD